MNLISADVNSTKKLRYLSCGFLVAYSFQFSGHSLEIRVGSEVLEFPNNVQDSRSSTSSSCVICTIKST